LLPDNVKKDIEKKIKCMLLDSGPHPHPTSIIRNYTGKNAIGKIAEFSNMLDSTIISNFNARLNKCH